MAIRKTTSHEQQMDLVQNKAGHAQIPEYHNTVLAEGQAQDFFSGIN